MVVTVRKDSYDYSTVHLTAYSVSTNICISVSVSSANSISVSVSVCFFYSITPFRHSGGRITYLTGIVQALFPDVLPKLLLAADYGLHKAEWEGADLGKLGVRAAYLVDVDEGGMEDYKRQLKEQKTKKGSAFVIAPHDVAELERKRAQSSFTDVKDPHADDVVVDFLESHHGSTFTLLVMLTDQNKYVGGDILVHKKRRDGSVGFSDPQPVENDVYEDEEDEDLLANDNRETHDIEIGQYRRFNAKTTEISRFAPDKGSMLLIDCQHDFGTMELLHGSRKVLIVELWEYNDSPLGSRVPSEEEGVKLGMKISNFAFDL